MSDKKIAEFFNTPSWGRDNQGGPVPAEDPLLALKSSLQWQNAWIAAVALAWSSEADKAWLLRDAPDFFNKRCAWKVPDGLTLVVTDQPTHDGAGKPLGWDEAQQAWYLASTKVIMYLPPPPVAPQQAVALANYLATGRTYPFTTC
jgi:ribosomally synthesized peptide (two-chain TOMM family)